MADPVRLTIDDLDPVTVPALVHRFWVMKDGVSQRMTLQQIADAIKAGGFNALDITGANLTNRGLFLKTGTTTRFAVVINATNEAGANSGSDLVIASFADDGTTILGIPIQITRSSLLITLAGQLTMIAGTTTKASFNIPPGVAKTTGLADGDAWLLNASGMQLRRNGATVTISDSTNRPDGSQALAQGGSDTVQRPWRATDLKDAVQTHGAGFGQTWQDMMASREFATSYQNLTGKPIMVQVMYVGTAGGAVAYSLEISLNNSTWLVASRTAGLGASTDQYGPLTTIVPPNHYVRLSRTTGTGTSKLLWAELR